MKLEKRGMSTTHVNMIAARFEVPCSELSTLHNAFKLYMSLIAPLSNRLGALELLCELRDLLK